MLSAAALAVVLLYIAPRFWPPTALDGPVADGEWTARSRAWFVASGFYPPKLEADTGQQFSWTRKAFRLEIPRLNRFQQHHLVLDVSAGRPSGDPVDLQVTVDGVPSTTERVRNERRRIEVRLPVRRANGVTAAFRVSSTLVRRRGEPRELGVRVHSIGLSPEGSLRPSISVAMRAGIAAALCVGGVLLCGLGSRSLEWLSAIAAAVAVAWLMLTDGAFLGLFADRLVAIGVGTFAIGGAIGLLRGMWPTLFGPPDWSAAAGLILCASAVKLAFLAHPMAMVGDGIFQVHRAQWVHDGNYFFTSITPSPAFEIPYPVGLYVTALPFWDNFPSTLDRLLLLRGLSLIVDALVGLALYAAARRQWGDPRAALLAAGLWPFARAPVWGLCNANLTNVFGQALFGVGIGVLAWAAAGKRMAVTALVAGGALILAAFLSHFGTVLAGVPLILFISGALLAGGRSQARRAGVWILMIGAGALTASYFIYYSHFTETYEKTVLRLREERVEGPTKLVAPPLVKLQRWLRERSDDYGLPGLPLVAVAAVGAVALARHRPREALSLILGGWAFAWVLFAGLGILTPIQTRVSMAAAPVFICLGAYGVAALAKLPRAGPLLAITMAAAICWSSVSIWIRCLGHL